MDDSRGAPRGRNRRGERSREEILGVAARILAERGYAGTSLSTLSQATGLPKSAIYHHFHSKGGLLSAVMARGAYDFFEAMRAAQSDPPEGGSPRERLGWYLQRTGEVFLARPDFLRLHLLLLMSAEATEAEVGEMILQVRRDGRVQMNRMIASAFAGEGPAVAAAVADRLDFFGMVGFDGAFITAQAEPSYALPEQLELLADAMAALGERIAAETRGRNGTPTPGP
ncbi:TetR/AcrR family transcriptional regulator [Blastococcus sp. SYSU D00820]